ncbi:MAG: hypothetical protein WBG08_08825 [Litorimonas sp.]
MSVRTVMTAILLGTLLTASVLPVPATAPDAVAQDKVAETVVQARHVATFETDIALTNQCVRDGGGKAVCLCVTKVLKHELTLEDYQDAVRGYVANTDTKATPWIEASHAGPVVRLAGSADFIDRCKAADRYFDAVAARAS